MSDDREKQAKRDMELLVQRPEFLRFLWRVIQTAGLFDRATDGSEGRHLAFAEGRRNLGLDILDMAETGQPVTHPEGLPILTMIQTLREESQQQTERPNAKRSRHDRTQELADQPDAD